MAYVLARGDLSYGFRATTRNTDAIRAHQKIQKSRPAGYRPEVPVSHEVNADNLTLVVSGRIDGVFEPPPEDTEARLYVEEIKTTTGDLDRYKAEDNPLHWGQAKTYAYMLARDRGLPDIEIRLTYCQLKSGRQLPRKRTFTFAELESFFNDLIHRYLAWAKRQAAWHLLRDASIESVSFPHPDYRPGQRPMAVNIYNAIRQRRQLLVQAPTGTGKTMAALFPAVKSLGQGEISKIFYLTARTTARSVAEKAVGALLDAGLRAKCLTLTAKDKICFEKEAACNGEECVYARGFFDRIQGAVESLFTERDLLDRGAVEAAAKSHRICPFEFSLELARWADVIICDYNYAFDPRVFLRRFFQEEQDPYVFLIDEAHNLVDRARDMFSAEIYKKPFLDLRRSVQGHLPGLHKTLTRINKCLLGLRKRCDTAGGTLSDPDPPEALSPLLKDYLYKAEHWLARNEPAPFREALLDLYFSVSGFLKIFEQFDESYTACMEKEGVDFRVKLFCMNPADHLKSALTRCDTAIFFSATLAPSDYFLHLLGCDESAGLLSLASPFPEENLRLLIAGRISTRYHHREKSLSSVANAICSVVNQKTGNYLLFFPSYAYLEQVYNVLSPGLPNVDMLLQTPGMTEADRDLFLERFTHSGGKSLVGLVVMGGIFGEGIDLVGERLSAAVVVGVGLPGISIENELIRDYFSRTREKGFEYAYMYPGINRVLQAAGRVIRSETDRGVVLLIDERFDSVRYRSLFPDHWQPVPIENPLQIKSSVEDFWRKREKV